MNMQEKGKPKHKNLTSLAMCVKGGPKVTFNIDSLLITHQELKRSYSNRFSLRVALCRVYS